MPDNPDIQGRRGLIETAAGTLRCPHPGCRKEVKDVVMVGVLQRHRYTIVLPSEVVMNDLSGPAKDRDLQRIRLAMACPDGHTSMLTITNDSGISVHTEWELKQDEGERDRGD